MTDQRLEDAPWGQLGQATYDPDQQTWSFKRKISYNYGIQPVNLSVQLSAPPLPRGTYTPTISQKVLKNHLTKRFPEIVPGLSIIHELEKGAPSDETLIKESLSTSSTLIGLGKARLKDTRNRPIDIVAFASGKAGEVLKIIRPQLNKLQWLGHEGGVHIQVLDPGTPLEECYWGGSGGTIRQVIFATEENGLSTWLAVRQIQCTTVFRPVFRREAVPAIVPKGSIFDYPSSRLTSNPVVEIPAFKTGGLPPADVAFNPFYVTQIAIVDQGGSWSIWNIEDRAGCKNVRTDRTHSGHILDKFQSSSNSAQPNTADGWGRIIFVGNVHTLIVCSRCHFAAFNLQGGTTRLQVPIVFNSMSCGWILDVKQTSSRLDQLFVLTSTRIFWLEVRPDADELKILYSCRHFRDEGGESMKLEILSEESSSTVFLYSGGSALINAYRLSMNNSMPECTPTSFVCQNATTEKSFQTHSMTIIAAPYHGNDDTGPGSRYRDNEITFYQIFTLSVELELRGTLCSTTLTPARTSTGSIKYEEIVPPSVKHRIRNTRQPRFAIYADSFIVPDHAPAENDPEESDEPVRAKFVGPKFRRRHGQCRPYALNFSSIFEEIFGDDVASDKVEHISHFRQDLLRRIEEWKEDDTSTLTILADFTTGLSFSGDIDDIAAAMSDLANFLTEDVKNESTLHISRLEGTELIPTNGKGIENALNLIAVYKHLIDIWVTPLPRNTPGAIRLSKERTIRRVAADLTLNSVAVSMIPAPAQKADEDFDAMDLDRSTPFSLSQPDQTRPFERRPSIASQSPDPGLLTPAYTPSLASEPAQPPAETSEDPSITLLHRYVDFPIQAPFGATVSTVLSHWRPGSDPSQYSWEARRKITGDEEEEEEEEETARRMQARKKRRERKAERYRRGETAESVVSHVPSITPSQVDRYAAGPMGGSQPVVVAGNMHGSQAGVPMTQVDDGQFGGRRGKRPKKTAGFR